LIDFLSNLRKSRIGVAFLCDQCRVIISEKTIYGQR
jgi:hypothetical protein